MRINRKLVSAGLFVFLAVFGLTILTAKPAEANYIGWKFNSYNILVENRTSLWGTPISNAVSDYNSNTRPYVRFATPSNLIHYQANYGATGWYAAALPYSAGTLCITFPSLYPTGYCNSTNRQVDFAYVAWNENYNSVIPGYQESIARHEMGHVFGLAHANCGTFSVMNLGGCNTLTGVLTTYDINDMSGLYP